MTGVTHVGRGRVDASVAWRLCAECLCSLGELAAPSRASRAAPASTAGALGRGGRTGARAARRSRWRLAGRVTVCQAAARRGVQDAGGRAGAGPPEPAPGAGPRLQRPPRPGAALCRSMREGPSQRSFRTGWAGVPGTSACGRGGCPRPHPGTIRPPREPAHGADALHFSEALSSVKPHCGLSGVVGPVASVVRGGGTSRGRGAARSQTARPRPWGNSGRGESDEVVILL